MGPGKLLAAALAAASCAAVANPLLRGDRAYPVPHTSNGIARIAAQPSVSAPSPFTNGCGLGLGVGTLYLNAEVEPWLAVNPRDSRHWIAAWQQDRWSNGSSRGLVTAVTFDAGATWTRSTARFTVCSGGSYVRASDPWVDFSPDGTLVNILTRLTGDADHVTDAALEVLRSTDRGATWSGPIRISAYQPAGALDPSTRLPIRDGTPIAAMAVAPDGALYVAWQDARMSPVPGRDDILLAASLDGGLTWSAPRRVNGVPGATAFAQQVHVAADGTIGVTYFDLRSDTLATESLLADYWLARSRDGVTWTETHLAGPFDLLTAPFAGGYFLGDYMGLASAGGDFLALHTRTTGRPDNPTDVFLARVPAATPGIAYVAAEAKAARADPGFTRRVSDALTAAMQRRHTARVAPP